MDERNRMDRRVPWIPWAMTSVALVLVAIIAYHFGAQREAVAVAEPGRRAFYGGFPGFWMFFLLFWILFGGLRRMWWGYHPYRPWRYGRYDYHPYDERDEWDDWHRQAHNRMDSPDPRGPATSSGTGRSPIT